MIQIVLPVVVGHEQDAVTIAQLESGVGEGITDAELDERWPYRPHDHFRGADIGSQSKSSDQPVVAGLDQAARADVCQLRSAPQIKIVDLDYPDAANPISAVDHGGVGPG